MAGTLYIVATPIGNLDDMPPRVAATFGAADFIAAEDTRVTMKLLNFLGLKKPMVSYYEHALQKGEGILRRSGKQSAALGLQLQPYAGAAVAAVVPFQRHDAAAGAQVCGLLGALWLTETGQQQRVGAKTMLRRAINHSSIIQDFGRMFHR